MKPKRIPNKPASLGFDIGYAAAQLTDRRKEEPDEIAVVLVGVNVNDLSFVLTPTRCGVQPTEVQHTKRLSIQPQLKGG